MKDALNDELVEAYQQMIVESVSTIGTDRIGNGVPVEVSKFINNLTEEDVRQMYFDEKPDLDFVYPFEINRNDIVFNMFRTRTRVDVPLEFNNGTIIREFYFDKNNNFVESSIFNSASNPDRLSG